MSFTPISRERALAEAVNVSQAAMVPLTILCRDHLDWALAQSQSEGAAKPTSIASLFLEFSGVTLQMGESAEALSNVPAEQVPPLLLDETLRAVAARHALSRFVGTLVVGAGIVQDKNTVYQGTTENRMLVDDHHTEYYGQNARGVVMGRDRLNHAPCEQGNPSQDGEQWYADPHIGLYVATITPAVASPGLLSDLTRATGSAEKAHEVIDAEHSVTLVPYLSVRYLSEHGG
jgi:hypothetical protein